MKVVAWIVQILVALAFLGAGFMKFSTPYAELIAEPNMAWAGNFSSTQIKMIGLIELFGALGLIVPMFVKKFRKLVPVAAIALALVMIGAMITHLGRGESIMMNVILLVLALLTAYIRRGFFSPKQFRQ